MAEACDIHGVAFKHGSVVLLARVVGADGSPLVPSRVSSACYSVELLDETDADATTPVTGHTAVPVGISGLLSETLLIDDAWEVDELGYNFRHELDVSAQPAFAIAGRNYRIVFELVPADGQVILVRFRIHVI
jgi:hypothetical protein